MKTGAASIISIGMVVSLGVLGLQVSGAMNDMQTWDRVVTVKGLSEREYIADQVIWPIQFVDAGNDLPALYDQIEKNSAKVEQGDSINYSSFVPFSTWQRFNINGDISGINVQPHDGVDRVKLADTIRQVIARKHGASVSDEQVVQVEDMFLKQKTMQQFLVGLQGFLGVIGFITLAVAGIGIANVMYATVKRSTRDIGVRMAVGATPGMIRMHYLVQSLMTMMMGGLLGLVITYTLIAVIRSLELEGNMFYERLGKPVPELSWLVVTIVVLTLVVIGVAAAWLPANRAAKVTPMEALQSE